MTNTKFTDLECTTLTVGGTDITAQIAEIANLEGLSATEVAFIDGAVAGTPATGKALVTSAGQVTAINAMVLECGSATMGTPSAETGEAVTVSVQLKDRAGADLAHRCVVQAYVSTDANGDTPDDGGATIALTAGTDGALLPGADASARATFVSEADGDLDIVVTDSAAATQNVYLHVVTPNGKVNSSTVIAFTA